MVKVVVYSIFEQTRPIDWWVVPDLWSWLSPFSSDPRGRNLTSWLYRGRTGPAIRPPVAPGLEPGASLTDAFNMVCVGGGGGWSLNGFSFPLEHLQTVLPAKVLKLGWKLVKTAWVFLRVLTVLCPSCVKHQYVYRGWSEVAKEQNILTFMLPGMSPNWNLIQLVSWRNLLVLRITVNQTPKDYIIHLTLAP